MEQGTLFVSRDFIKHRPHIHYLMKHCGKNSAGVIATYNSQKKTITLREDAFELCSVAEDFVRLSLEDEMNTRTPNMTKTEHSSLCETETFKGGD